MGTDGTGKFLEMAEECCRRAEQALSQPEKEAWLRSAREWTELTESAEKRDGKRREG
jgi:hypothetical protein